MLMFVVVSCRRRKNITVGDVMAMVGVVIVVVVGTHFSVTNTEVTSSQSTWSNDHSSSSSMWLKTGHW